MTAPLDLEAVKRRAGFEGASKDHPFIGYKSVARNDSHVWHGDETRAYIDADLDRRDLIAEVDRLTAKVEDQTERIAQLHRELVDALDKADRLSGALGSEQARAREAERARDGALDKLRQAQNAAEKAYRERDAAWARLGGLP